MWHVILFLFTYHLYLCFLNLALFHYSLFLCLRTLFYLIDILCLFELTLLYLLFYLILLPPDTALLFSGNAGVPISARRTRGEWVCADAENTEPSPFCVLIRDMTHIHT